MGMTPEQVEELKSLKYIKDCWEYQQEKCPEIAFSKIDKVLYQLDKEKGNKVIY